MANIKLNPIVEQLSGKFGKLSFRRYGDETVLARLPDREGYEPSEAQLEVQDRFRAAANYGNAVMADPEALAPYEEVAAEPGANPIFSIIMSDYLNPPTVNDLDVSGFAGNLDDEIVITAYDKFEVMSVSVTLSDASDDSELESGDAELGSDGRWVYRVSSTIDPGTTVNITAIAYDRPGNTGESDAVMEL